MDEKKLEHFTFYKNYFDIIKYLKNEDKLSLFNAIMEYMFEDKEPNLDGLNLGIWNNIKMPLKTTKNKVINGKKGGAPKGNENAKQTTKKQLKSNQKTTKSTTKKQANNISLFLFLISSFNYLDRGLLRGKIEEWLKYKDERKETYTEVGLKSLLTRIQNNCEKYSEEQIADLIDECMSNNWKGIIWEKLKGKEKTQDEKILEKFDTAEIKIENENQKELEELIKSYE